MLEGHRAARARALSLLRAEGPRPEQAVAEAIAASQALAAEGRFPGPRDPVSERAVEAVRQRWARIGRRAREEKAP
jgi:hypothetical protein